MRPMPRPLLVLVDEDSGAGVGDGGEGELELLAAIAAERVEDVAGEALGVDAEDGGGRHRCRP